MDLEVLDGPAESVLGEPAAIPPSAPPEGTHAITVYDTRLIPAALLARLRNLQQQQQCLMDGCVAGLGIDLSAANADFNLQTGLITIIPLPAKD